MPRPVLASVARAATCALALTSAACGEIGSPSGPLNIVGFGCGAGGVGGVELAPESLRQRSTPLAVGVARAVRFEVGPPEVQCEGQTAFRRVDWAIDELPAEGVLRVRLADCDDCTVLYEGQPGRFSGLTGAATLDDLRRLPPRTLTFEVVGLRPGLGSLRVAACEGPGSCLTGFGTGSEQLYVTVVE